MGLPEAFLSDGDGGGVIQGSASEGTLVAVLAAKTRALKHMRRESAAGASDSELLSKMTLYTSDQVRLVAGGFFGGGNVSCLRMPCLRLTRERMGHGFAGLFC